MHETTEEEQGLITLDESLVTKTEIAKSNLLAEKITGSFWRDTVNMLLDIFPNFIYSLGFYLYNTIGLVLLSKNASTAVIDGFGIGVTWHNIVGSAAVSSLCQGTITLCSQAFGASNSTTLGLCIHRGLILRLMFLVIQIPLLVFSYYIFKAFQVDDDIAVQAAKYCNYIIIAFIPLIFVEIIRSYYVSNHLYVPLMVFQLFVTPLNYFLARYFILDLNLEIVGYVVAYSITLLSLVVIMVLYLIVWEAKRESLFFLRKESFEKLLPQLKIEIVIATFFYLEQIAWQILTLLGASYSNAQINAQVLITNVVSIVTMPMFGLNIVATTYAGAYVGKKNVQAIKACIIYSTLIGFTYGIILVICLFIWRRQIVGIYSTNEDVITAALALFKIIVFILPMDFVRATLVASLKSIGREKIGSLAFVFSYYVVGLAFEYTLGTVAKLYDVGLWIGMGLGIGTMLTLSIILIIRTDLKKQVDLIQARIIKLD